MATNATFISNTLVSKYLVYDGLNMAFHDFPTHNDGEFLIKLLFPFFSKNNFLAGNTRTLFFLSLSKYFQLELDIFIISYIVLNGLWLTMTNCCVSTIVYICYILHELCNSFHDMRRCIPFMCKPSHNCITCKICNIISLLSPYTGSQYNQFSRDATMHRNVLF